MERKRILLWGLGLFLFCLIGCDSKKEAIYDKAISVASNQYGKIFQERGCKKKIPKSLREDKTLKAVGIYDWTSGFFAGSLWYLYELTGDSYWSGKACVYTDMLHDVQFFNGNHDVGLMINCSYGNGCRLTENKEYKEAVINAAKSLITRFNPSVGCLKSWNYRKAWDGKTEWFFPVIIDNMMSLDVLFNATNLSGDTLFRDIALQHAKTTMKNHYRPDYSCYHVVDYDASNGSVKDRATCQGFTDESNWARGQAWGLYGYVVCYRETKDPVFLEFAKGIAHFIMTYPTLPKDKIPYWDYDVDCKGYVPQWNYEKENFKEIQRDVSAATITASALFELSTLVKDGQDYYDFANDIVFNLSKERYLAKDEDSNFFILKHSVGSMPHGQDVDKPLVYADYYFLEALLRKKKIDKGGKLGCFCFKSLVAMVKT